MKYNISTNIKNTFLGDDWLKFLLSCKYTIGVEGGSSILDPDGEIKKRVDLFIKKNPKANFSTVKKYCKLNMRGNLNLKALSPRHLEACMTKTCQILIEGNYGGILIPWKHYIPLKKDFSNIDKVISIIKNDISRKKIITRTYKDIVASNKYSYQTFVNKIENEIIEDYYISTGSTSFNNSLLLRMLNLFDKIIWVRIRAEVFLIKLLPKSFKGFLKSAYQKTN